MLKSLTNIHTIMKKNLFFFCLAFLLGSSGFAQTNVQLNIHHKMGESDFAFNTTVQNNSDHDFQFTRVQYYLSGFTLVHDNGLETEVNDLWVLVDAGEATAIDLGSFDLSGLEAVRFHVGVDADANHLDPSAYPSDHPLAPKSPSMHWGWTAGYRFAAVEGMAGANMSEVFQLHGLGDGNYFETTITTDQTAMNNEIIVDVNADYIRVVEDMDLNAGVNSHGASGEAQQSLENFRDYIFTNANLSTSTEDISLYNSFVIFPNPSKAGQSNLSFTLKEDRDYEITITNALGQTVKEWTGQRGNVLLQNLNINTGWYIISLYENGKRVGTKKMIVQ